MKKKNKLLLLVLLLICSYSYGQVKRYAFRRELEKPTASWHKIVLPDDIFSKVSADLSDLRIYGVTAGNDTIEAPYILRQTSEKASLKEVGFKLINTSYRQDKHYFTFEVPSVETVNQIGLAFKQQNFDWRLKLEGSQNQEEWATIADNYRILSIKNGQTDFQFTNVVIPNSSYLFFRMTITAKEAPGLISAKISKYELSEGTYRTYPVRKTNSSFDKVSKQTEIILDLVQPVPVTYLKINVADKFEYYRPLTIEYVTDSIKTEQGWKYNYGILTTGTLNSLEKNEFKFESVILQKLRIIIQNRDSQPLTFRAAEVKGYVYELVARFTEPADYFLAYGNDKSEKPQYDIERFAESIPDSLSLLELGPGQVIHKSELPEQSPLFSNDLWLWVVMVLMIGLLGWFSIRMMKKKQGL